MVVSTFMQGTDMAEVMTVVAEEQAKVAELKAAGTIGALYLATATRGTVFFEIFADDTDAARAVVASLPMAKWWDIDVFPINAPVQR
jgi:muconolactone delta-isomerase